MNADAELNYLRDVARPKLTRLLNTSYKWLLWLMVLLVISQMALMLWASQNCANVFGLSLGGRIFESYSFTCENPNAKPVFNKNPTR